MSLRIRRGTNAQRTGVTLDLGEIAYTTDTKKLYVGDGITAGGVNILKESVGAGLEWDNTTQTITYTGAPSNALQNIVEDTHPQLGGNLDLNNRVINGTGSINIIGGVTATLLTLTDGVDGDLSLNSNDIIDVSNITASGNVSATTLSLTNGMSTDLSLNSNDITGNGNIDITGDISASGTITGSQVSANSNGTGTNYMVGDDVYIGDVNVTNTMVVKGQQDATKGYIIFGNNDTTATLGRNGSGPLTYAGDFSVSGTLTATTGLGANLPLNGRSITGTGNINITGSAGLTTVNTGTVNVTRNLVNGGVKIETNNSNLDTGFDLLTVNAFYDTAVFPASMLMSRSRGTKAAPTAVQAGDVLGAVTFTGGTDADTTKPAAIILTTAIAPITTGPSGIVPGQVQISTTNSAGDLISSLTIDAANGVVAGKALTPGVYATTTDLNTAITAPSVGMLVYVSADSKFYGYVDDAGGAVPGWVALN